MKRLMNIACFLLGCVMTLAFCREIVLADIPRPPSQPSTATPIGWKPRSLPEIRPRKGEWLRGYCDAIATAAAYLGMPSTEDFHRASADIAEELWDIQINYPDGRELKVDCLAGEFSFKKEKLVGRAVNIRVVAPAEERP